MLFIGSALYHYGMCIKGSIDSKEIILPVVIRYVAIYTLIMSCYCVYIIQ